MYMYLYTYMYNMYMYMSEGTTARSQDAHWRPAGNMRASAAKYENNLKPNTHINVSFFAPLRPLATNSTAGAHN